MSLRWIVACVIAWVPLGLHADPVSAAVISARSKLQQRLQVAYPEVTAWTLTPMLNERQMNVLATDADVHIDAVKLGRRSAVQLSWRTVADRHRQVVWFDVEGQRPAWRLNGDLKRNGTIAAEALRADAYADWEPSCSSVAPETSVQGMRVRKAMRAGDLLCAEDIEPKPPVSRGERVLVHSSAGLVTVVVNGIAEQDGKIGDRLPVRDPASGELYMASVSAEGEVVVRQ